MLLHLTSLHLLGVLGVLGGGLPAGSNLLEGGLVVEGGLLLLDDGKLLLHEHVVGGQLLSATGRLLSGLFLGHFVCVCGLGVGCECGSEEEEEKKKREKRRKQEQEGK